MSLRIPGVPREFGALFLTIPQRTLGLPSGSRLTSGGPTVGPTVGPTLDRCAGSGPTLDRCAGSGTVFPLKYEGRSCATAKEQRSSRKSSVRLAQRQKRNGPRLHPPLRLARTHERTNDSPVSNRSLRKLRLSFFNLRQKTDTGLLSTLRVSLRSSEHAFC